MNSRSPDEDSESTHEVPRIMPNKPAGDTLRMSSKESGSKNYSGESLTSDSTINSQVNIPPIKRLSEAHWEGKTLGQYKVTGILGSGGMGVVLKAHDPLIDREVAIKILPDDVAANPATLNRFLSEARAAGKLNHPNVTSIYQIGQEQGYTFLVLEYVQGANLADTISEKGAFSVLEATRIAIDVCKGLTAAHEAQLIHRDIKPANLLRGADNVVKITDFGLVKSANAKAHEITQAGAVVGTPYFMSPEQCQSQPLDGRSDVYSLGATYYCLLTGRQPYQDSDSIVKIMFSHCHGPVPDPRLSNHRIPPACAAIIRKAMAKSAAERYATPALMQADLEMVAATLSGETPIRLPSQSHANLSPAGEEPSTVALQSLPPPTHSRMIPAIKPIPLKPPTPKFPWGMAGTAAAAFVVIGVLSWKILFGGPASPPPEDGKGEQQASQAGVPVAKGEPIKVGILHSVSGTMAASSTVVVDATVFAIEEINQAGGLLGRPIKAVVADGRSQDEVFASEARRLITDEKVSSVFGCWTSSSRKTVKPIFEELDHLLLYPLQYEGLETSPNIFYFGAAPNQQIIPAVEHALKTMGKKKFFLIGSDYVFPRTANEIIKDVLKKDGGSVVGEMYIRLGGQDVQQAVDAIRKTAPDMILNTINGDTNTAFFRALRQAGITAQKVPTMSFSVGEQELRQYDLSQFEGDYAAWTYFQSIDTPENKAFVERFQAKYPQRVITDPMEAAYSSVKLWAKAVEAAKTEEPKAVRRALLSQRFLAPGGPIRVDSDTQHCFKTPRLGQIQMNGQFRMIWSTPEPTAPVPFPASRTTSEWKAFLVDLYTAYGNHWSAN